MPVIAFYDILSNFESRFLDDEEKGLLLTILDSLAKGKRIQVQQTVVTSDVFGQELDDSKIQAKLT